MLADSRHGADCLSLVADSLLIRIPSYRTLPKTQVELLILIETALVHTQLSPRELAYRMTDREREFLS